MTTQTAATVTTATESEGQEWTENSSPACLHRRFEFPKYLILREFLVNVGALSNEVGIFPDISFGSTYVNMTIYPPNDDTGIGQAERDFAARVSALVTA